MTNRENFLSLLRRQGYERVPVEFVLSPHQQQVCREELGAEDYEAYFGMPWRRVEDLRLQDQNVEKYRKYYRKPLAEGADIDIFGVGHEKSPNSMHMTYMRHPLEDVESLEELKEYPYPDYEKADGSHQAEQVRRIKEQDLIALGDMQMTIWECAWYMRSMEELYCKWIKPRLKKIIDEVKKVNPGILIFYHSCGFIEPLIPHLIEAGIDVLNPIQSECMNFGEIYRQYGDRISFHGTIGTQTVMPHGTPEEVRKEVWKNLDIAGEKGGLFVAPTHMIEPEVPLENILAYVDACRTYK